MSFPSSPRSVGASIASLDADRGIATGNSDEMSSDRDCSERRQDNHDLFAPLVETRRVSDSEEEEEEADDNESSHNGEEQYNFEDNGNSMVGFNDSFSVGDNSNGEDSQPHNAIPMFDTIALENAIMEDARHTENARHDLFDMIAQMEAENVMAHVQNERQNERHVWSDHEELHDDNSNFRYHYDQDLLDYLYREGGSGDDDENEHVSFDSYTVEEEDLDPCTCPHCLMDRITGSKDCCWDNEDDLDPSEKELFPDASPCAICMEPETDNRPFVHLPCCSPETKDTSSTRFCKKCAVRCIVTKGCAVPCHLSKSNCGAQLMGECPRCKQLLALEETETLAKGDKLPAIYKRTRLAKPSTDALFWYIARNGETGGAVYRAYLKTLAVCPNPHFIPEELLFENYRSPEMLLAMCQWGLLCKRKGLSQNYEAVDKITRILLEYLHDILLSLWQGIEWMGGSRLENARNRAYNWRISKLIRYINHSIQEKCKNEGTAVYSMDPLVHFELRLLVFRYLHCFDREEWLDHECDCEENDREENESIKLLPPLLRAATSKEQNDIDVFSLKNCRHQCYLEAWKAFGSASRSFGRLRVFRGLWLMNLAISLVLLSSKYLGLPPIIDWPLHFKPNSNSISNMFARWRWHLLTGLNVILIRMAVDFIAKLLSIGWDLILAASFCLAVGSLMEALPMIPAKGTLTMDEWSCALIRAFDGDKTKREKSKLFNAFQTAGCAIAFFYILWKASFLPRAAFSIMVGSY